MENVQEIMTWGPNESPKARRDCRQCKGRGTILR